MTARLSRRAFLEGSTVAAGSFLFGGTGLRQAAPPPVEDVRPPEDAVRRFAAALEGTVVRPSDASYDAQRRVWNGLVDKHPLLIARCTGAEDVVRSIGFARRHGLPLSVRGGGHHAAGFAVADGGLMVDLAGMKRVRLGGARTVVVGPGITAGELHRETQESGLMLPTGTVSTVGVGGLTLGGGEGWLTSRYGLTCDNLLSAEVVTGDGAVVRANPDEHDDLFWALRGGGGNFGVVTSFEFRVHELTEVVAGSLVYPLGKAPEVLRAWRDAIHKGLPDELSSFVLFFQAPEPMVSINVCYLGPLEDAAEVLQPLQAAGRPLADTIRSMSPLDLHTMHDAGSPAGPRRYWRSHYLAAIPDDAMSSVVESYSGVTSPQSVSLLWHLHGAFKAFGADDTAYPHRDANYMFAVVSQWSEAVEDDRHVAWARSVWEAVRPFATGGSYSNFTSDVGVESVARAFRHNLARLGRIKRRYDPDNFFRFNLNIPPAA